MMPNVQGGQMAHAVMNPVQTDQNVSFAANILFSYNFIRDNT